MIVGQTAAAFCEPSEAAQGEIGTQVIDFHPAKPKGKARRGDCWTESIAVDRPDAFRCMVRNEIYDPCFRIGGHDPLVVCSASPDAGKSGFLLRPVKPLPVRSAAESKPRPWKIELADGTECTILTGTTPFVNDQALRYACSSPSDRGGKNGPWLGAPEEFDRSKPLWKTRKVLFDAGPQGPRELNSEVVDVSKVWQ